MSKLKIAALAAFLGCGLAAVGAIKKVEEINEKLGTELLDQELEALKKEF